MLDDSHQKSLKQFTADRAAVRSGGCNVSLQDHFNCSGTALSPLESEGGRDNNNSCVSSVVQEDVALHDRNDHSPVYEEGEDGQGGNDCKGDQRETEGDMIYGEEVRVDEKEDGLEQKNIASISEEGFPIAVRDRLTRRILTTDAAQEERGLDEEGQVARGEITSSGDTESGTKSAPKPVKRIRFQVDDLDSITVTDGSGGQQYLSEPLTLSVMRSPLEYSRMQPSSADSPASSTGHSRGADAWSDIDHALFTKVCKRERGIPICIASLIFLLLSYTQLCCHLC